MMQGVPDSTNYSLTSWLTHNQTIQAIATICTLLAGGAFLFTTLRFAWRFVREVYQTSFKRTLKRWRRAYKLLVILAAADVHIFVGAVVYFGSFAAIGFLLPLFITSLAVNYAPYLRSIVSGAIAMFIVYGVAFVGALLWLSRQVVRRRLRRRSRARRMKKRAARLKVIEGTVLP